MVQWLSTVPPLSTFHFKLHHLGRDVFPPGDQTHTGVKTSLFSLQALQQGNGSPQIGRKFPAHPEKKLAHGRNEQKQSHELSCILRKERQQSKLWLEQTLRQADNLKPHGPGWKEAVHDRSHLFKGQTRKANIGSFYSLFFIHQHQERSVAAPLEEKKEMDSRQERNGSYLWRIANLSCLQTFPLNAQGWEGGQGGGFSH